MTVILFSLFQIAFAVFFTYLCIAFITGAPFVPSTNPVSRSMIKLSALKKGMKIYDLGSGEGKLLFLAAQAGADATGFEINPFLVWFTNSKAFLSPYRHQVRAKIQNFWTAPIADADVIYVYLLPWRMEKLEQKLQKECRKGTLIVSNSFIFPHLTQIAHDPQTHVYVFRI